MKKIIIIIILQLLILTSCTFAIKPGFLLSDKSESFQITGLLHTDTSVISFHNLFTNSSIKLYQKFVSPYKGSSCFMHPHCSLYGQLAFKKYNPIKAFMMTSDRLHRCGHDLENYNIVEIGDYLRYNDPLEFIVASKETGSRNSNINNSQISSLTVNQKMMETTSASDSLLYNFAFTLQINGDFINAIVEYQRLISYYPNSLLNVQANLNIFDCYYLLEDYFHVATWGKYLLEDKNFTDNQDQLNYKIGLAYLKLRNFPLARVHFNSIVSNKNSLVDKSIMLKGLSYAYELNWEKASKEFNLIKSNSQYDIFKKSNLLSCEQGKNLNYRNSTIAGVLAIVPGLGYLYDGYPKTAISSLIVNGLFFWGTYSAFDNENYGLGTLMGVFSFGWYSGNIYGSIMSAKRMNNKLENNLLLNFNLGFKF